jgi:hypothetical protein
VLGTAVAVVGAVLAVRDAVGATVDVVPLGVLPLEGGTVVAVVAGAAVRAVVVEVDDLVRVVPLA